MSQTHDVPAHAAYEGVLVRQREARDLEALVQMFNQPLCRRGMVSDSFASADALDAWLRSNGTDNFECVATIDHRAIALAALFPCLETQRHAAWMIVFVHDDYQNRGIGTLLMSVLVTTAHAMGVSRIQLMVVSDNERAIALYRKFDFEIEGHHRHYARRGDEFITALTMARVTTEGSSRYQVMEQICRDLRDKAAALAA